MPKTDVLVLKNKLENNKAELFFAFISTFIWGLAAHAYMFLNNAFSHDSLNEFFAVVYGNDIRIAYGRVFVPAYRFLTRSAVALPWLIGILALCYIAVSVFLVLKLFNVKSKFTSFLIAGIFTVNITVIATAGTYLHDLDCDMMALLLSTIAVFIWQRNEKYGFLAGSVFVTLSMGFYQSYVSVTITLVIIYLLLAILKCEKFKSIMTRGLKAIAMIIIGGIIYFFTVKAFTLFTNISLAEGDGTSLDQLKEFTFSNAAALVAEGIKGIFPTVLLPNSILPEELIMVLSIIVFVITVVLILYGILNKNVGIKEAVLAVFLVAMLPVGMNVAFILSNGRMHDVMMYSFWLFYLLILLINSFTYNKAIIKTTAIKVTSCTLCCIMTFILWSNVQTANALYMKKDFEYDANLSFFTRVVYTMENHEDYIPGETPVVFVGKPKTSIIPSPAFEKMEDFTGAHSCYTLGVASWDYYRAYFDYVLLNPAKMADSEMWSRLSRSKIARRMPVYPAEGSMRFIGETLVVKLG